MKLELFHTEYGEISVSTGTEKNLLVPQYSGNSAGIQWLLSNLRQTKGRYGHSFSPDLCRNSDLYAAIRKLILQKEIILVSERDLPEIEPPPPSGAVY